MTLTRTARRVAVVLASWSTISVSVAAAQDTLARVRDLYTSAAYDEALALLDASERPSTSDSAEVDQYRAFCLFALGRSDEARKVIEQIVAANPLFQPSETQVSPRLKEAFRDVRRRVLPSVVRRSYAEAKAAFDRRELDVAGKRFESVITLLDDADVVVSSDLVDLKILATGFLDLIKTTPPPAAAPPPSPSPAAAPASAPAATAAPNVAPRSIIYGPTDTDVTPPVAISQVMPPWHPSRFDTQSYEGAVVLVIDETGAVTSINPQGRLPASYITQLRRAASTWKFQPAMRNGAPVKYNKVVGVRLSPTG